jgi:putative membrane-bound dehydrogenase-like protein
VNGFAALPRHTVTLSGLALAILLWPETLRAGQESAQPAARVGPLSPAEEHATFHLAADLSIELVAAEPDVLDPVAVVWDEHGRMYVVEMGDYPTGPPGGRIKLLEDRNGDGRIDHTHVFADKLSFPTSAQPWLGGLLVAAAPDILYLKDTDGDGVADERKVLLTGFGEGNQQLRVNSLVLGIDNWIYAANGRSDGSIRRVANVPIGGNGVVATKDGIVDSSAKNQAISIRHRDFRFHPITGRFQAAAGFTQHGHAFDDWGCRFIGWNTVHIRHVVWDQGVVNSALHAQIEVEEISDHGSAARVFPASKTTRRFNIEPAGFVNASCGLTIYRGDLLGGAFRGNAFVCEPLSNLVHRDVLKPSGATFIASRAAEEQDREFLTSTDSWFRPVNLTTGPDGALYVVDFYRAFVEHPQYVRDEEARKSVDWREGSDRGRIWRIMPKGARCPNWPRLGSITNSELVLLLEHTNGWQRDTAQRLIVERQGRDVVAALVELARHGKRPQGRVHALRTLQGIGALDDATLDRVFDDPHPAVREHAIRLAEPHLPVSRTLNDRVVDLADDPDPRVQFQVACTLSRSDTTPAAIAAITRLARRTADDPWLRRAILTCSPTAALEVIDQLLADAKTRPALPKQEALAFLSDLAATIPGSTPGRAHQRLQSMSNVDENPSILPWKFALWTGLIEGRRLRNRNHEAEDAWQLLGFANQENFAHLCDVVQEHIADDRQLMHVRTLAVRLLAHLSRTRSEQVVRGLLAQSNPPELQVAGVRSLQQHPADSVHTICSNWSTLTPVVRRAVIDVLLGRRDWIGALAAKVRADDIPAIDLDATDAQRLLSLCADSDRPELRRLLTRPDAGDRQLAIEQYRPALSLAADRTRGAALFTKQCMTCHSVQGKGQRIGPDLASVAGRPSDRLLVDILDPSREVGSESYNMVIATKDGRIVSGILAAESDRAITLRRAEGVEDTVSRDQIEQLRNTGKSLMPEGFERMLTQQEMADLLEFLRYGEPPE